LNRILEGYAFRIVFLEPAINANGQANELPRFGRSEFRSIRVQFGHFSILTEITQLLIAPMEMMGYTLPEHMLPDISHGKMFCQRLRDVHGIDTNALPTCLHIFEDGRRVWPKAYPEQLLAAFRKFR
jgi:hypothetical protein